MSLIIYDMAALPLCKTPLSYNIRSLKIAKRKGIIL